MHVNVVQPLACITAFWMDKALLSISLSGHGHLVKMLIILNDMVFIDHILHAYTF